LSTTALRDGIGRVELMTRMTTAVLALASGVYTYLGVRDLLDGNATTVVFAAVIYSAAVSVGIYAFWSFMMRFLPHVRSLAGRVQMFAAMVLGCVMIVAMSSWLNAAALAGSAALEQHLAVALESYSRDLDRAHNNALAAQSLLPDIELASTRFSTLAAAERSGALTGSSGSGTVVQLLTQMSQQLDSLSTEVRASAERTATLHEEGNVRLTRMRELVSERGPIAPRSDAFGSEATALLGVLASLQQTSVAPAVRRAADDLSRGFIAPIADGAGDLAVRQAAVVGNVQEAVAVQSAALAAAADEILAAPPVEAQRFKPLSTAEAVLVYAADFIPSWAGAISIDLMPAVLVLVLMVVHAAIRREGVPVADGSTMTAADLITAMRLLREVDSERVFAAIEPPRVPPDEPEREDPERDDPSRDDNVMPMPPNRLGKKE
jgi:hypothetical protein